jgi:hypothetical protein
MKILLLLLFINCASGEKSTIDTIKEAAQSEQGKKMIDTIKEKAQDKETQNKIKSLLSKDKSTSQSAAPSAPTLPSLPAKQ